MSCENHITKLTNDNIGTRIYRNDDADGTYIFLGKQHPQCHLYAHISNENSFELFKVHTDVLLATCTTRNPISRPLVDWSRFPVWFHFIAQDSNRTWHVFRSRPFLPGCRTTGRWTSHDQSPFLPLEIPHIYAPTFSGCWYDSLVERPQS